MSRKRNCDQGKDFFTWFLEFKRQYWNYPNYNNSRKDPDWYLLCMCSATQSVSNSTTPWTGIPPGFSPWNFQVRILELGCHFLLQKSSQPKGSNLVSCTAGGFFTSKPWEESLQYLLLRMVIPYKRTSDSGNTTVSAMGMQYKEHAANLWNQVYLQKSIRVFAEMLLSL